MGLIQCFDRSNMAGSGPYETATMYISNISICLSLTASLPFPLK